MPVAAKRRPPLYIVQSSFIVFGACSFYNRERHIKGAMAMMPFSIFGFRALWSPYFFLALVLARCTVLSVDQKMATLV